MDMSNQNSKIWFTSDLHFGHNKDFLYAPRGFDNIYSHDKEIIQNWNTSINDNDIVYVLGDIMLNDNDYGKQCFNQLKGIKHIILGNHDTVTRQNLYSELRGVVNITYADVLNYGKYHFFLCHYPTLTDNFDRGRKTFNLHGHTHSPDKFQFIQHCCYNVALDAHNNQPVEINEIINDLRSRRQEYMNE